MKILYTAAKTTESLVGQLSKIKVPRHIDRCYVDVGFSGTDINRPQLNAMLAAVSEGDTIYVPNLSRLSRNVSYVLKILDTLNDKGVKVVCQQAYLDKQQEEYVVKVDFPL